MVRAGFAQQQSERSIGEVATCPRVTIAVDSTVAAIKSGVEKVSFVDGRTPHSVMLEIFTDKGVGTEVVL